MHFWLAGKEQTNTVLTACVMCSGRLAFVLLGISVAKC